MTAWIEDALTFDCQGAKLLGVLARPAETNAQLGMVIVVGGPQYRAGAHRSFAKLARGLAGEGVAALRFDYRGQGDSEGEHPGFEGIDADIRAAIDALLFAQPELTGVLLWGLCDAASAIALYAEQDKRVSGVVLVNPWVRTEATAARANLRHYYGRRLTSADFWGKVGRGAFKPASAISGLVGEVKRAFFKPEPVATQDQGLSARMARALGGFARPVLCILSGEDLTAREFADQASSSPAWQALMVREDFALQELPEADHTFSSSPQLSRCIAVTVAWMQSLKDAADESVKI